MKDQNRPLWQLFIVTFTVLLFCLTNSTPAQTVPEIAEKALAATVYLEMQDSNGKILGFGSGFFVRENLIATNYHVINRAMSGTAKLVDKSITYTIEGVAAIDKTNDLAVLKATASAIKPLPLGDSDTVRIGEAVYVAGNPKGLEGTFSNGIISGLRGNSTKERLQMTAPISPGSSGGPVLNSKGEVIGVSFLTLVGGQNLNFAISINLLKKLLNRSGAVIPFTHVDPVWFADVYFKWGEEKYKLGDYENAIADYDMAVQLNPDHADAYNNRGNVKYKLKQCNAAIADYDLAIRLNPNHADAYNNRGKAKHKLGQYRAAITDYNAAIQLKPDHAEVYNNRGKAEHNLGQYVIAITDYDMAIHLNRDNADAYNNRGRAKHKLKQYAAAIADYDTAIRLKPDYAYTYIRRGFVKEKLGQPSAAIADYDTAIRLKPDYAFTYYNRGSVKLLLGHTYEAKQDFQTALRLAEHASDDQVKVLTKKALELIEQQDLKQ
ncbi:MAG: tetratricopeptide repeat protein [Candidatus Poribacteria bacterium]|nr:tetratricopeptide repeat protein [Candidatus Poribacteria bacterium]